jgi:small-conductance mechanosensitive channel/CRP-like cAMP-binding protein
MDSLPSLAGADLTSEEVGIPLALVLLLLARLLLPARERRRARHGAVLLALSVACDVARFFFRAEASVQRPLLFAATFFLLASIGRSLVLLLVDVLLERRTERPAPKIFRDLSTAVAYLVVALVALRSVGVEPGSILTTSALLTAVIGLSLQDTLGNLVSGMALQMQRPFDVGDWIEVDAHAGQVTEVTWRATSVMTVDRIEVILPNASVAKAAIRNYSRPSKVYRRRLVIGVTFAATPSEVHAVLAAAAADAPGVLPLPAARARTKSFGDSAILYEVLYFVDDFARSLDVEGAVADRIYHALERHGLDVPFPTRAVLLAPPARTAEHRRDEERARIAAVIGALDLMQPLPEDSRALLIERATLRRHGPGEVILRKGDPSREMFVVERGSLAVEVPRDPEGVSEVAQLGAGEYFGEMGLLTGEVRSATVRSKTVCDLVVIDHDAFRDVLAAHPEVLDRMGGLLASRQAGLQAAAASDERGPPMEERKRHLSSQIRSFFKLV